MSLHRLYVLVLTAQHDVIVREGVTHFKPVVEISEPEYNVVAQKRDRPVSDMEQHVRQNLIVFRVTLLYLSDVGREVRVYEAKCAVMNLKSDA